MQGGGLGAEADSCLQPARLAPPLQDMVTYFLNLSQANAQGEPRWELEYRVTKAYGVPDAGARSMHEALGRIASDQGALQRYYVYNSVSYDTRACDEACQAEHVCALREVAFDGYAACLRAPGVAPAPRLALLLVALLGLRTLLVQ